MRINFLGGPDSRKTTTALRVAGELKRMRYSLEYVNEYVKSWAYGKRDVDRMDQFYIQAKQMQYEYRFLKAGVKNIISDSPVALGFIYGPNDLAPALRAVSDAYDREFPCYNIFLIRGDAPYDPHGRYQSREKAVEVDAKIKREIKDMYHVPFEDFTTIMDLVLDQIDR